MDNEHMLWIATKHSIHTCYYYYQRILIRFLPMCVEISMVRRLFSICLVFCDNWPLLFQNANRKQRISMCDGRTFDGCWLRWSISHVRSPLMAHWTEWKIVFGYVTCHIQWKQKYLIFSWHPNFLRTQLWWNYSFLVVGDAEIDSFVIIHLITKQQWNICENHDKWQMSRRITHTFISGRHFLRMCVMYMIFNCYKSRSIKRYKRNHFITYVNFLQMALVYECMYAVASTFRIGMSNDKWKTKEEVPYKKRQVSALDWNWLLHPIILQYLPIGREFIFNL